MTNFYGTATVKLRNSARSFNGQEFGTQSSVTLTINGRPHTKPIISLILDPETADGLVEGEQAKVWFYSSLPATRRYTLKYNVFQTGDYLDLVSLGFVFSGGVKIPTGNGIIQRDEQWSELVSFYTIDDEKDEPDDTLNLNIRGAREGLYFKLSDTNDRATIAIKDNDVPAVTISPHRLTNPDVLELPSSYAMFVSYYQNSSLSES